MNGKLSVVIISILLAAILGLVAYVFVSKVSALDLKDANQDTQIAAILISQGDILKQIGSINTALSLLLPRYNLDKK